LTLHCISDILSSDFLIDSKNEDAKMRKLTVILIAVALLASSTHVFSRPPLNGALNGQT